MPETLSETLTSEPINDIRASIGLNPIVPVVPIPVEPAPTFLARAKSFASAVRAKVLAAVAYLKPIALKVWSVIVVVSEAVYAGAKSAATMIGDQYKNTGSALDGLNKDDVAKSIKAAANSTGIYGFVLTVILVLLHGFAYVSVFILPNALIAAPILFITHLIINLVTRLNHGVDPLATIATDVPKPTA